LLAVRDLCVAGERGGPAVLRNIDLELRGGEVLGIGGLMGAGRSELLMHLFGAWGHRLSGTVELEGRPLPATLTPAGAIARRLVLVSEDRQRYGLVSGQPVAFNLSLSNLPHLRRAGLIDHNREAAENQRLFRSLRVKAPDLETSVGSLSGGNQQKVVLGKALMTDPRVVLLDEPTRGIDVGAKLEVYELINRLTAEGRGVVLVSSELPELLGMSDRIVMLSAGRIGGVFAGGEVSQEALLAAAMGRGVAAA
jgi:D-xylose transport system ATP-binding protein